MAEPQTPELPENELAPFHVFFFAQHFRQKQHGKAMAVGIAVVVGVSDQAVGTAPRG